MSAKADTNTNDELAVQLIWLRLAQIKINEYCKEGKFYVPVHLALGHEAIAVAINKNLTHMDSLFLTHRNAHYNLVRQGSLREELDEYLLLPQGLAKGRLGSMNLSNPAKGIYYSSSILGNNLPVASGYALGNRFKMGNSATFVVTGDGAMEEGAFYESLLFMKSFNLSCVIIVENNGWSLATEISERRANINLKELAKGLDIPYFQFNNNDVFDYTQNLETIRKQTIKDNSPVVLEVSLNTLGYWTQETPEFPEGKFINYHSGAAPNIKQGISKDFPLIDLSINDPLFVLKQYYTDSTLEALSHKMAQKLEGENN
ncbi:MAG: hypothetical protein CBC25_04375 [Pelagibacteraceae bacterium TMED65]|nr:MAG: hypothetical protein CBC25_04375 [Pelagibacteraceae bacterium TMED65]